MALAQKVPQWSKTGVKDQLMIAELHLYTKQKQKQMFLPEVFLFQ